MSDHVSVIQNCRLTVVDGVIVVESVDAGVQVVIRGNVFEGTEVDG